VLSSCFLFAVLWGTISCLPCYEALCLSTWRTSYEVPHYAVLANLPSLDRSSVQIFLSAPCSQTPSVCVAPLMSETLFLYDAFTIRFLTTVTLKMSLYYSTHNVFTGWLLIRLRLLLPWVSPTENGSLHCTAQHTELFGLFYIASAPTTPRNTAPKLLRGADRIENSASSIVAWRHRICVNVFMEPLPGIASHYVSFKHILISLTNFMGTPNSMGILYNTSLLTESGFLKTLNSWCTVSLYSHFFLQHLTNAKMWSVVVPQMLADFTSSIDQIIPIYFAWIL
jgi:hypothetical protein